MTVTVSTEKDLLRTYVCMDGTKRRNLRWSPITHVKPFTETILNRFNSRE